MTESVAREIPKPSVKRGGARPGAGRPKKTAQEDAYQKLAKAKADRESYLAKIAALNYKEKAGELVNVDDVKSAWEQQIQIAKSRLMSLPARLAPEIVRCDTLRSAEQLLSSAISDVLTELADGNAD